MMCEVGVRITSSLLTWNICSHRASFMSPWRVFGCCWCSCFLIKVTSVFIVCSWTTVEYWITIIATMTDTSSPKATNVRLLQRQGSISLTTVIITQLVQAPVGQASRIRIWLGLVHVNFPSTFVEFHNGFYSLERKHYHQFSQAKCTSTKFNCYSSRQNFRVSVLLVWLQQLSNLYYLLQRQFQQSSFTSAKIVIF